MGYKMYFKDYTSKISFKKYVLLAYLMLSLFSCIGTVEDLEQVDNSKQLESVKLDFDGVFDCYAISQDKIEIRFNAASVVKGNIQASDLVYQAFLNGNYNTPANSNKIENLRQDSDDYYHLTIPNLVRNTSYSISVKALDPSTNTIDQNIKSCNVRTLDEEYPLFDGLQTAEPTPGLIGQTEIFLKWNSAVPAKFILGSIPADGYKIKKYKIYWSTVSGNVSDMSLLTEVLEDSFNPITEYRVSGLLPGNTYYFMVRAEDESIREEQNIKILETRTNLPSIVSFAGIKTVSVPSNSSGYTSLNVSWDKAKGDFNRYRVFTIPKTVGAFSSSTVNPNSTIYLKADITDVSLTSALIPGLDQEQEFAVFVVACMYDTNTSNCTTYDGEDKKLVAKTLPPLAPFAGVGAVAKLSGTAGLSSVRVQWNPPAISQGVCDEIKMYFVNGTAEEPVYTCNDPLNDPSKPCFSAKPTCTSSEVIMSSVSLDTEFCFRAKVYENGREQVTTNKKCFTNTIQKPVFLTPPSCTPLAGGTEMQIDWTAPNSGDYSNYVLFVQEVPDTDTSSLNANQWMTNAITFYEGGAGTYTAELLDKTIVTKKLRYKIPDTKYRIGIKTLISTGGNNYYDENANVIECRTNPLTLNFGGWQHITSIGPRINGVADHKTSPGTVFLPKNGYAAEELDMPKRGVISEYAKVEYGRIKPFAVPKKLEKNIYNSNYWTIELVDPTKRVEVTYTYDNSLSSNPYRQIQLNGDKVEIKTHGSYYTANYCQNVAADIAADPDISALIKLNCYTSNSYFNYSYGSFPIVLDGKSLSGGDSGFVVLNWDEFSTSNNEKITDFIFNNQITENELDGYYIYRKESPIANTKTDINNLLNNIQGSSSGWVEVNPGKPIKNSDQLVFIDYLPNGSHPVHGTNPLRNFREKADTGKVVWYTVRYKLAGKLMNISQDGNNTDSILQVLVPPANMATIHPWIANMQMCKQMGKDYDRVNDYRCDFGGLGARKIDNQYYYDLDGFVLVDRWQLGCNVTFDGDVNDSDGQIKYCNQYPATDGQWLTEAPDRSCYLRSSSNRPFATVNSVAYQMNSGLCLVNEDDLSGDTEISNWKTISQVSGDSPSTTKLPAPESSEALGRVYSSSKGYGAIMSTNDSLMPPLTNVNFMQAHYMCQSHAVQIENATLLSAKIRKRQLTAREYQHAAAPSMLDTVERPIYEHETVSHGNENLNISSSLKTSNSGSGHCNADARYYNYLTSSSYYSSYTRVISGKLNYMYTGSYTKANFVTGSYGLSGSSLYTGGTESCVSGFGMQDYVGINHFLNDHALCKKYADDSNATCEVFPDQTWKDAYTGFYPLTKFIEDDYADQETYKNAFGQKFFWKFYDDGTPGQFGLPRAQNTKYVFNGSYSYPSSYIPATNIWKPMAELGAFSFVLGQPLNCLLGESYCHPDDKGQFLTRSAASDYGTEILNLLSSDFEIFYPMEYTPNLTSTAEYFERVLTLEGFSVNNISSGLSYNFTFNDGSGGQVSFSAGSEKRTHHRYNSNWNNNKNTANNAIGVRCGVKVKLDLNGSLKAVDEKDIN